jgi:diguanylate cyclase
MSRLKPFFFLGYSDNPRIAIINIQRILMMAYILTPLHILLATIFWIAWTGEDHASGDVAYYWRMGIICAHGFMSVVVGTACVLAYYIKKKKRENSLIGRAIPNATAFGYLLFGVVICIIDQLVTPSISPFLMASVAVAVVVIMRPQISTALYVTAYLLFYFLLPLTQTSADMLLSVRVNGISAAAIGLGISLIGWRTNLINFFQKNLIEKQTLEMEEKNRLLLQMAGTDILTGLYNRMRFMEFMDRELARIRRMGNTACLMILDLDHFKQINDQYGHPQGDIVLKSIGGLIKDSLREMDTPARFGGEEFIVLLPDTTTDRACMAAEKIRKAIEKHTFSEPIQALSITASFGIATIDAHKTNAFDFAYQKADQAMYQAKAKGRNRVECVD